jgi:hypothetical protein
LIVTASTAYKSQITNHKSEITKDGTPLIGAATLVRGRVSGARVSCELDDHPVKDAAETAEQIVTPLARLPRDGIAAERTRHVYRPRHSHQPASALAPKKASRTAAGGAVMCRS